MKFAKRLTDSLRRTLRETPVPWGPLGYPTYRRTYSRMTAQGKMEEWADTVERCLQGLIDYGMQVEEDELCLMAEYFHQLKIMPAGRGLWQLGTATVDRLGAASLMNCYFISINSLESFCFLFDMLMLGGGVGFSVMPNEVFKLPNVKEGVEVIRKDQPDVDYIVADNREGWVELLRRVLQAFFVTGKSFTYSCHCVRSKGAPIKGFGGVASGPEELAEGISQITAILQRRANRCLRPIDALDICNIIGSVVVSGNVRRSAEIAIGYSGDSQYIKAKRWDLGSIPNWRAMSNNTVSADTIEELSQDFWHGYEGKGEPYGLFNLDLCRKVGRLIDGERYPDKDVKGLNPCGEQTLEDGEACDLVEQVLPNYKDLKQFMTGAQLVYKIAKTMITLPHHWSVANDVMEKNRRIGIGVTGVCQQSRFKAADFDQVYEMLRDLDMQYSRQSGVNPSIKLTTAKPSGTVSLLPGVTPGIHPAYAPYYIRRIRMSAGDKLLDVCRDHGYHVEPVYGFDGLPDKNTMVVSFPVKVPKNTTVAAQMSAVDQLKLHRHIQTYWSDNAVSVTVYYRGEELPIIREYLAKNYKDWIKTVSFLRHNDHGFRQAPYEEITKEQYQVLASKTRLITSLDDETSRGEMLATEDCSTGSCPIR